MTSRDHPLAAVLETVTPACCPGRINFHCHTTSSDGSLQPEALAEQALTIGLEHLAVTDHHSTAAYWPIQRWFEQQAEEGALPPQLWTGMEISCLLKGCLVHVLALGFDLEQGHRGHSLRRMNRACAHPARPWSSARRTSS